MKDKTFFVIFVVSMVLMIVSPLITLVPCWISIDYNFDAIDAALSGNYVLGETLHQSGSFWGLVADTLLPFSIIIGISCSFTLFISACKLVLSKEPTK